jgi:hypothetical protein
MKKISIAMQKKEDITTATSLSIGEYLVPIPEDSGKLKAFHVNKILHVIVKGEIDPRSLTQLALYWVCCQKVADNTDFPTDKDVDEYVKKKCHYVEWFHGLDGKQTFKTKSISYENMDQPDFNKFMDDALPAMAEIINVTPEALVNSRFDI